MLFEIHSVQNDTFGSSWSSDSTALKCNIFESK